MALIDNLTYPPVKAKDLIDKLEIPRTTFYRQINKLIEDGLVIEMNGGYTRIRPVPTIEQVLVDMELWLGQKRMDSKFRRLLTFDQVDMALQWYISNNPKPEVYKYEEEYFSVLCDALRELQIRNKCYR